MATTTTLPRLMRQNALYIRDAWNLRLPRWPVLREALCVVNLLLVPLIDPLRFGYWKLTRRI